MATAATISILLELFTKGYDKGLTDAEKKAEAFAGKIKKVGDSVKKTGLVMSASLTAPILLGFKQAIDAASDLQQSTGAVETVFGNASKTIFDFGQTSASSVGLAESEFNQLSAVTGSFLQNLGYDAQAAAEETLALTNRAADMASVFNTDVSQALQAIQSGLKGEFNPLEQFGIKMNQNAINAKALAMGLGESTASLTDNAKAQAALAIIMEQTDRISGNFNDETDTLAHQMQVLKAEFKDAAASLGNELLPMATDLLKWAVDMVDKFNELDGGTKKPLWSSEV